MPDPVHRLNWRALSVLDYVFVVYAAGLLLLSGVHFVAPQRDGPVALTQVFAPHLFVPLVVLVPVVIRRRARVVQIAVVLSLGVAVVRFLPGLVSLPVQPSVGADQLSVMTWNLAAGDGAAGELVYRLTTRDFDVVALQEVRREHLSALEADPRLRTVFHYRLLQPETPTHGIALLSRLLILDAHVYQDPPTIVARVRLPSGDSVTVATAHIPPPAIHVGMALPFAYATAARDEALSTLRDRLPTHEYESLVLVGDFNVTDREIAYAHLAEGLTDAHLHVGMGPGSTWRPATLDALPFGVLRIDYLFTAGLARALHVASVCAPNAGDHCAVEGVVEIVSPSI